MGTYKLNNKTIVSSATSLTVTNTETGLTIGENMLFIGNHNSNKSNVSRLTSGRTEVNVFNSGFGDDGDKISMNILGATVSYKNGQLTFSVGNASWILNFTGS